jgi:hypothetical protein
MEGVSAISPDTPGPSRIPASRNECVPIVANGVVRNSDLHDQCDDFHSTDYSIVWLVGQNEMERRRVGATCLIWPGEERLPKVVVARP